MELEEGDPRHPDVEEILKAGNRAARLTRQLLAFSRKQVIQPEILNVNAQIHESMGMLRRLIGENMDLQLNLSPDVWPIEADRGQFEQILINLIVNARDAIEEARTRASEMKITIETTNQIVDENYAEEHGEARPGNFVVLIVSDTGKGMSEETLSHIFEPFFTTKELSRGTGLGLATIYGIVKQNGGNIYVYSEPDKGTTFKILWPAAKNASLSQGKRTVDEEALRGNETILVVEDEDEIRAFVQRGLERLGYNVLVAANGKEALAVLNKRSKSIDLLFTDVIMPQMDGRELADVVTKHVPEVKILFASGYTDNHIAHRGILDRGIYFINKPFSIEQVAEKIRDILNE
jgi:CheY-like chemotaxis protein